MKNIFGRATAAFQNHRFGAPFVALVVLLFATFCSASQSSISQRASYNSDRQLGEITSGSWGIDERAFANGSITYTRTPATTIAGAHDTFFQFNCGVGYAIGNLAFDVGFQYAQSPLTEVTSLGGSFGLTYIFIPKGANEDDYQADALNTLHTQVYHKTAELPPLFWVRFGYTGNTMKSDAIPFPANSGKETALSVDFYYPFSDELLFSFGAGYHGYDDSRGFYDKALANAVTAQQLLLQSTLQGLPHSNYSLSATWQFTQVESILPRYQMTEIDSTRQWSHTIDLAWRHQFLKTWYLTPTYELTISQATPSTALVLELLYVF